MSLIVGSSVAYMGGLNIGVQASGSSITSLPVNLSAATTTGNSLVVLVTGFAGTTSPHVSGITLGGNAFTKAVGVTIGTNNPYTSEIWYYSNAVANQQTITISLTGGSGSGNIVAEAYELPGSITIDKTSSNSGTATTSWSSGTTAATTSANELWFGCGVVLGTPTINSPWISQANGNFLFGYQSTSSTGTAAFAGTQTAASAYSAVVATFSGTNIFLDAPSTTLSISPPAGYSAGQLFLLATTAGSTSGAASSLSVSGGGWTALQSGNPAFNVYWKSATGSEPAYVITYNATCVAAAFIASYQPSIVVSDTFNNSSTGVLTYTPSFPGGVTAGQSVECFIANLSTVFNGDENIAMPSSVWTTEVAPFGPGLIDTNNTYYPVNVGLCDVVGTATAPAFTSGMSSDFYNAYVILQSVTATLSGTGTVSATGNLLIPQHGTGTFSGIGTVAAVPSFIFSPLASLSGTGNTAGKATHDLVASSAGTGTVTPKYILLAAVTSNSTSQIIAKPSGSINPGVAILSGLGDHSSQVDTLSSIDTITATGTVAASPITSYTSTVTSTGTVLATAFIGNSGVSLLAGTGAVSAIPTLAFQYFATLSGQSSVSGYALSAFLAYSYMNAIFQLWTLPPSIIAYGVTSIPAVGTVTPRPAIVSHPTSTGIGTVTPNPYLIQRGKATLAGTGHLAANIVVPLHDMTKRGRGKVLATPYVTPAPIALIRGAGTLLPKDFFLLSVQKAVTWNTHSKVSQIVVPYWNDLVHVATTKRASWNIVRSPAARLQGQGNVSGTFPPHATLSGTGRVSQPLAHIARQLGISWNTRIKVPVTQAFTWDTIGRVRTTKHVTWNTIVHIDPGVHFTWNTNCLTVSSQQALSWNDLKKVTTSQHCSWNTHGLIKSSKPAIWNTEKRISSIKAVSWDTRAKISPLLHVTFNDTGRIKSSQKMTWSLAETALLSGISHIKLAQHLSVGKQVKWDTCARVYSSQAASWDDLHRINSFSLFKWNMQGHLVKDLIVKWDTRTGPMRTMRQFGWDIEQPDIVFPAVRQTLFSTARLSGGTNILSSAVFFSMSGSSELTAVNVISATAILSSSASISAFEAPTAFLSSAGTMSAVSVPQPLRLFGNLTPPVASQSFTGPIIVGTAFQVNQGGMYLQGFWYYIADTNQSMTPQSFALWTITGTTISPLGGLYVTGSQITSGSLSLGWNYVPYPTPLALTPYTPYRAQTGFSGNFLQTLNQFGAGDPFAAGITNGALTAYSDSTGSDYFPPWVNLGGAQCGFTTASNDPTTFPASNSDTSFNCWLDVQVSVVAPANAVYRIWPNDPVGGSVRVDFPIGYTIATEFNLSVPCRVVAIDWYSPTGATQLPTRCAVWDVATQTVVSGTDNTSPSWAGAAGSGWIRVVYDGSVVLQANKAYKVSVFHDDPVNAWFSDVGSYWTPGSGWPGQNGITNGPLTAPSLPNSVAGQSTYKQASVNPAGWGYPGTSDIGANDWTDIEVQPLIIIQVTAQLSGSSSVNARAYYVSLLQGSGNARNTSAILRSPIDISGTSTLQARNVGGPFRFFPSTNGPASSTGFGGTIILGTLFEVTSPGFHLQGYWYWRADSAQSASPSFALWQATGHATGSLIANTSVSGSGAVIGQWNFYTLTPSVALTANTPYKAVYGISGNFLDTASQFNSGGVYQAGITNGSLFAFSDSTGSAGDSFGDQQCEFDTSTSDPTAVYPTGSNSGFNCWIDIQVG